MSAPDLGVLLFGFVQDAGGGHVDVVIERDTEEYPELGTRVALIAALPDAVFVLREHYESTAAERDALQHALDMALEALDIIAMDGEAPQHSERAMARIVARSTRAVLSANRSSDG